MHFLMTFEGEFVKIFYVSGTMNAWFEIWNFPCDFWRIQCIFSVHILKASVYIWGFQYIMKNSEHIWKFHFLLWRFQHIFEKFISNVRIWEKMCCRVPHNHLKLMFFEGLKHKMCVYEEKCSAGYPIFQKNGVPCGSEMLIYAQKGIESRKIPLLKTKKGYPEEERHRYTHTAYFM